MLLKPALLVLEEGSLFHGQAIGAEGMAVGEVVFNTAMTGYQEILTDPSYAQQIVTLTYPHIGNVGINREDEESATIRATGLVIRDYSLLSSSWRAQSSLGDYLKCHKLIAIAGVDTRRLTRLLRESGSLKGCIMAGKINEQQGLNAARQFAGLHNLDLARTVSTTQVYQWYEGCWRYPNEAQLLSEPRYFVVAYDFGIKRNILRLLSEYGCRVTVVPAQTSAEEVLKLKPDGVFLSNGPGDPAACDYAIKAVRALLEVRIPLFGICLGHQILALACGAKTIKMKLGHHGANHPVLDIAQQRVWITSQNHGFVVDDKDLSSTLEVTHRSLFDGTIQGLRHKQAPALGFQGHPEASPGPHDASHLFKEFINLIEEHRIHPTQLEQQSIRIPQDA